MIIGKTDCGLQYAVKQRVSPVAYCALSIKCGTRDEEGFNGGIAHFVEHTIFKGTSRRSAAVINGYLDRLGGELNAFTTKEEIVIHATVLKEDLNKAVTRPRSYLRAMNGVLMTGFNRYFISPLILTKAAAETGKRERIEAYLDKPLSAEEQAIYDEIDTGISGKTSRKIGVKLREIAKDSQVICVTHSAQIATLADNHFLISKKEVEGRAQTSIRLLDRGERVEEAARILGGINITDAQRAAAKDMLDNIDE